MNSFRDDAARILTRSIAGTRAWRDYTLTTDGRANHAYIRKFKDIHAGERCVIIGNGPSLRDTDLSLLRDEYTFERFIPGHERVFRLEDEIVLPIRQQRPGAEKTPGRAIGRAEGQRSDLADLNGAFDVFRRGRLSIELAEAPTEFLPPEYDA